MRILCQKSAPLKLVYSAPIPTQNLLYTYTTFSYTISHSTDRLIPKAGLDIFCCGYPKKLFYNARGHKLRFPPCGKSAICDRDGYGQATVVQIINFILSLGGDALPPEAISLFKAHP